ncbi:nuclear transport factor 2 family protein [Shinella sp. PSBB067]|uniref:nuclear transport factor 2 family protein n=1 Tax=Shinella sp. PSBB067 TaxID=2715959 RepID=UPI00193BB2B0|nr:nuclear transport factor 2 family protein [Shinella sp. PSBB067]QRI62378.1 nuclear transport factor 2 family protein [Shinella sp. PSBB067]
MSVVTQTMTDEQRKSVALDYLKRLDRGDDIFALFAPDAQAYFPKFGIANGIDQIRRLFASTGKIIASISHDYAYFNYVIQGDMVVVEGTSSGSTTSGRTWQAGVTHAGRWCDVFEISDFKIQRLFIYLDPDYGDEDLARYPWIE